MKENIRKKEDNTANDQSVDLKDTVAGFGAKIQVLETDVKSLKESYTGLQTTQQNEKQQLDAIRSTVDSVSNASRLNFNAGIQNETSAWMQNLTNQCTNGLKNVSDQLTTINDTFSQKIKSLDAEMHDHHIKLDNLIESFANVSSHVTSIESEWPKFKQANQKYDTAIGKMANDITALKSSVVNLTAITRNLQSDHSMANKKLTNAAPESNVR